MFFQLLFTNLFAALAWIFASVIAFTFHEFGHAFAAHLLGDSTPEKAGRLTLNPLSHVDPIGFLMLLMAGFGWAKPVPFTPSNLKHPRSGSLLIGLAGPSANAVLASVSAVAFRSLGAPAASGFLPTFLFFLALINIMLVIFNAIPVPPLDGSKLLFALLSDKKYSDLRDYITLRGPQILILLAFVSIVTRWNPFELVSTAAFHVCDSATQVSCNGLLDALLKRV